MANTYYKYVQNTADDFVDWSAIGKQMSDVFTETNKVREEKKAAIDEESRKFGIYLSEPPQGESASANQYALDLGNEATSAKLMQLNLLKSGQLKLRDYLVQNQNLKDGVTNSFDVMKEFQERYKSTMDRLKAGDSQNLEGYTYEEVEGFGDFTKSKLYINPTDFTVSVAMKEKTIGEDGKEVWAMSKNPNKFTTISSLRDRVKARFDKYDVAKNMTAFVDRLGEETNALVKIKNSYGATGIVSLLTDITARKNLPKDVQGVLMDFEKVETLALQSELTNPYNVSSILTNSIMKAPNGKPYTFTRDEKERNNNPNLILLKNTGPNGALPVFTDEQEKAALEHLRLQARLMYDKKEKIETSPQLRKDYAPDYVNRGAGEAKERELAVGAWNGLSSGKTLAEKQKSADILLGTKMASDKGLMDIKFDKEGEVTLVYENPELNRTISMVDEKGKGIPIRDWAAKGVELHGENDVNKALRAGGGNGVYADIGKDFLKVRAKRQGKPAEVIPQTADQAYTNYIDNNIVSNYTDFVKKQNGKYKFTKNEVVNKINETLSGLDIVAKPSLGPNMEVFIKVGSKESPNFDFSADKFKTSMQSMKTWIKNNPPGVTPADKKDYIKGLMDKGITGGGQEIGDYSKYNEINK